MLDGGFPREQQDTGKNAADFVDWKFVKDYGQTSIDLDALIVSHCDADHYGGLWNLLDVSKITELDASQVRVEAAYHAGLSWWKTASGGKTLGTSTTAGGETVWTQLLDDRASVTAALGSGGGPKLAGWWASFMQSVADTKNKTGQPTPIQRLGRSAGHLPGFGPNAAGDPVVHVLGPVERTVAGSPALRKFPGGESKNTNGVSILLRLDYGRFRMVLTGDLNKASQASLLADFAGQTQAFECDVAKACHHGSDDVSYRFLQAMRAAATVISSGDNEGHDHPRPTIIAASATTGFQQFDGEDLLTPLIFSTELARSIDLAGAQRLEVTDAQGDTDTLGEAQIARVKVTLKAGEPAKPLRETKLVRGLIYGLVNVRTDGSRILCATRDEISKEWRIETFNSRF
jgi:hypothetical protein